MVADTYEREAWTNVARAIRRIAVAVSKKGKRWEDHTVSPFAQIHDGLRTAADSERDALTANLLVFAADTLEEAGTRSGEFRGKPLKKPRAGMSDAAYCFIRANAWHRGDTGGSLWGPMGDRMRFDDAGKADSLAVAWRLALGYRMGATEAWQRAIFGS